MVERRRRAEVARLDERHRQAARRRVERRRQAVDAAADDEDVVTPSRGRGSRARIASIL